MHRALVVRRRTPGLWGAASRAGLPLALLAGALPAAAAAQPQPLTATRIERARDSSPEHFAALGDRVLFTADTPAEGRELWATDGTPEGTHLVVDLLPGRHGSGPRDLIALEGRVFFVADDVAGEARVFETDGTAEGTRRSPLFPADRRLDLKPPATWPGWLVATDSEGGGLWRSDGRTPATRISPEGSWGWDRNGRMVAAGGALYAEGSRILRFTADGTFGVAAEASGGARIVGVLRDQLVFQTWGEPGGDPAQLWLLPGAGPAVRLGAPGRPGHGAGAGAATASGLLLFQAREAFVPWLWRTDGTESGTRPVTAVGGEGSYASEPVAAGDRVFFVVADAGVSRELWTSDGTAAGTVRLELAGALQPFGTPTPVGRGVVFAVRTPGQGWPPPGGLWVSDGTAGGTRELASLALAPRELVRVRDEVWFAGVDGVGEEPWRTDGTVEGTRRVADVSPEPGGAEPSSLAALGAAVLFAAEHAGRGRELWRADVSGAALLVDLRPGAGSAAPHALVRAGDRVFLYDDDGAVAGDHGPIATARLIRTDGTHDGTTVLRAGTRLPSCGVAESEQRACVDRPVAVGDRVHLVDADPGPLDGVHLAVDASGEMRQLGRGDARLGWPTASGEELWFLDHPLLVRATGSSMVAAPAPAGGATELTAADGGRLFLGAAASRDPDAAQGLWVREPDGRLLPLRSFAARDRRRAPLGVRALTWIAPRLYFAAGAGGEGLEPWTSDGTAAGTTPLGELAPGVAGSDPDGFVGVRGEVFFWADDGAHGREPWVTDGTAAGTHLVADLWRGPSGSVSSGSRFVPLGPAGPVAFAASDGVHGSELWVSDGTEAGTRRASDLAPGVRSSSPAELTVAGDALYFAADDAAAGGQLFAVPLAELAPGAERYPPPAPAQAEPEKPSSGGCPTADGGALAILCVLLVAGRSARRKTAQSGSTTRTCCGPRERDGT